MKPKLEASKMRFFRMMLSIPWTDHEQGRIVRKKKRATRNLILTIRKRLLKFLEHTMMKYGLVNLKLARQIGRRDSGKQ